MPNERTDTSQSLHIGCSAIVAFKTDAPSYQYGTSSGNTHQHLPVVLTVADGWQASNHPFSHQLCLEISDEVLSVQ